MVEESVLQRDLKYIFDGEGRAVRRQVLVRRKNLVGLGKEGNRVEERKVLGLAAVRGRVKRYVDPNPFQGCAREVARGLGVSLRTVFDRRAGPKSDATGGRCMKARHG